MDKDALFRTAGDSDEYGVYTVATIFGYHSANEELIPWDVGGPEHLAELMEVDVQAFVEESWDHPQAELLNTNIGCRVDQPLTGIDKYD